MTSTVKKIVSVILAVTMMSAVLFCFPIVSEAAESGLTVSRSLDLMEKELWDEAEGVTAISERTASGSKFISASADPDSDYFSFSAEFEPMELSGLTEIIVNITVRGDAESYPVTLTLSSEQEVYEHKLNSDSASTVWYIPLPENIAPALTSISFSFDTRNVDITYINITDITADNSYTYSYINTFLATDIYSENKTVKSAEGVSMSPENGVCSASVLFAETENYEKDHDILLWIKVNGISSGTIMLSCEYKVESESDSASSSKEKTEAVDSAPRSVTADGIYFFVVKSGFIGTTFVFSSLSEDTTVFLNGAGHSDMGARETYAGSITDCGYSNGKISVSGSLTNDASVEYYGSKLLLFAVPLSDVTNYDLKKYDPVATASFSTKFTLSCDMNDHYLEYFYKVVLETDEGYIPVGNITCADSATAMPTASSAVSALYGADAADVFETDVSSVILDVYAGKLLETADIYSAFTYNYGSPYYFNRQYLTELDDQLRFFESAGVQVYLRIYSDRDGYAFDYSPDDPDSLSLMCAVSSFISERYPDICGFIVGSPLNRENGAASPEYAEKKARIISAFYESVRSKNPEACVILPFASGNGADLQLVCSMLCYYLSKYGTGPTVILYETATPDSSLAGQASYFSAIPSIFSYSTDGAAVMWNVPEETEIEETTDIYRSVCLEAASMGMRFAALNVKKADKSSELYDSLKMMMDGENVIPATISQFSTLKEPDGYSPSVFGIWDFTSSYDTAGWVSGGSFSSPITAKGTYGARVLKAQSSDSLTGAGILIGKATQSLDMTEVTARVCFTVLSSEAETAEICLIFGSGESRAEFSAVVDCNEQSRLLCDMSAYSGASKIDYVAVIVRGVADAEAEISKVEMCSETLTDDQLSEKYSITEDSKYHPLLYAIIIFIVAATVAIFSALLKKQKTRRKGDGK